MNIDVDVEIPALFDAIKKKNVEEIKRLMKLLGLEVKEGKIIPKDKKIFKARAEFWDRRQLARKILLNSLYGSLLNEVCRFYDERLGQSTTLSGRTIVKHMNAKTNEVVTGLYDYKGDAIVYADTDSCYFSAWEALHNNPDFDFDWTDRDSVIELYDSIADEVNASFPEFMVKTFNTNLERGSIIKGGRELVASTGLFIKKKKYGLLCYEFDGHRYDVDGSPGKLKAMGLDLKRADTPKVMQKFLEKVLMDILQDVPKSNIFADIKQFRIDFTAAKPWEKGTPKAVKGLAKYSEIVKNNFDFTAISKLAKSNTIPQHVLASMNWNKLCDVHNDKHVMRITDGSRIVVCRLRPKNFYNIDSIAYPIDEPHLPKWLKELPFDEPMMETIIIDKKLENLVGVLDWNLLETMPDFDDEITFEF